MSLKKFLKANLKLIVLKDGVYVCSVSISSVHLDILGFPMGGNY